MLTYVEKEQKTYEERLAEAVTDIPLYTSEWTNFNPSDPAMTILETLVGFITLQQDSMDDIPLAVRRNLLKMVGFSAKKGRCARLLLSTSGVESRFSIPANHKFVIGDIVFETNREIVIDDNRIIGIYGKKSNRMDFEEEYLDFSYLMDRETKLPALVFGEQPFAGDCLYLIANKLPEAGKEITLFVNLQKRIGRNAFDAKTEKLFADVVWECYTDDGWIAMDARDNTNAFLMSGEIRVWMPDATAAIYEDAPISGYAIRARLKSAQYDVRPKVVSIDAFLFEVWQKNTISECHSFSRSTEVNLISEMTEEAYIDVFCREEKGESYRKYEYNPDTEAEGRFYDIKRVDYGNFKILFDKSKRGIGPKKCRDCVKVVVYTEDVMRQYSLGRVLGYDNQEINLPFNNIVGNSFCILAKRKDDSGAFIYDFVRPEHSDEGALFYHLLENDGKIVIEDAGHFIGADLYLAAVALNNGPEGNIREGNFLKSPDDNNIPDGVTFFNPVAGTGGCFKETIESVRQRFLTDMEKPYTAVTEKDYENLVLTTPGLCIHKAKAQMDEERNLVKIAVKQGTDEGFPRLSDIYQKIIKERVEERRLLTTRVELIQPIYMPVNVNATVYVKTHFDNAASMIEETIRERIDYLNSEKNFGEVLKFDELFHAIEMLDCVEYVYDLSLRPKTLSGAKMRDADVVPDKNCLLYPGEIHIETVTFED
ncbi:MAG: hypothetical protein E7272_00185 [Pseudobutyrivibrio ruminis]|uniref:Baseplate protein J-like domain-containing protein n=1 Tax=Pseudobutyrivibrio ruminis TaxID=46206 RepID=A0A927U8J3_9FIRM|nr:hypothetical protein [Pseudobutyrivibrio ruminis]